MTLTHEFFSEVRNNPLGPPYNRGGTDSNNGATCAIFIGAISSISNTILAWGFPR
jgi:hypothetical protein